MLADRRAIEERVERHHAFDVRGRDVELVCAEAHHVFADEAVLLLAQMEKRNERRHLRWIAGQNLCELLLAVFGELEGDLEIARKTPENAGRTLVPTVSIRQGKRSP
jgi:hypothetical protein